MPYFFIILLKINLVLVLFAVTYYLILRRLTFYTINRMFLVLGILFSSFYPFINLTNFFHRQQQINHEVVAFVPKLNQKINALVPSNFITDYWQLISILFYLGVILMSLRLITQFFSLYQMHRKSAPGAIANHKVRILAEEVSPFSFWQTVYINPSLHQEYELDTILAHELIHVKQWHSLDIILAELSVVFYWFNPGVWLMKKAVKENLEFITDQKILNKGIDKKTYQYSLLDVGNLTPAAAIVNNFNLSDLKKRIRMMNVKRSSRLTLSRYLLVTPLLLLTTLAFTVSKKEIRRHLMPLHEALVNSHLIDATDAVEKKLNVKKPNNKRRVNSATPSKNIDTPNKITVFIKTIFIDSLVQESPASLSELPARVVYKRISTAKGVRAQGPKEQLFLFNNTDSSNSGSQVKNLQFHINKADVEPGQRFESDKVVIVRANTMADKSIKGNILSGDITYIINGKKVTAAELKDLKPEDIKNVQILRGRITDLQIGVEKNIK